MRCQLVWIENKKKQTKAFDDFFDALKQALVLLDQEIKVEGITKGEDLLGDTEWIMGSAIIKGISMLMPDGWRE